MSLKYILPGTVTDETLPFDYLDPIITEGTLFVARGSDTFSWAGQDAPSNGDLLKNIDDINNAGNDASWLIQSGSSIGFADGEFDFTGLPANKNTLLLPASIADALWGAGSGLQYFAICMYVRFPSAEDWWSLTSDRPFLTWAGDSGNASSNYTTDPEIVMLGQQTNGGVANVWARRQTAIGATQNFNAPVHSTHFENVVQMLFYRTPSAAGLRLKGASATSTAAPQASGAPNAANFSGKNGQLGIGSSLWPNSSLPAAINWGLRGIWIEDLSVSGRDPIAVADADFDYGMA
jgi:hypothetical protein